MTSALGVFTRPGAKAESQLDQVSDRSVFGVRGGVHCGHDRVDNLKGDSLIFFDRMVLNVICFNLTGEASIQSSVGFGVWRMSRVGEAIQEVGYHNRPPHLRNQLFPKLVQASLGVVVMLNSVSVYL